MSEETIKIIKGLYEVGFTPLNIVLVLGLCAVWRSSIVKDRKQTKDREAWHDDTRSQVAELKIHTAACEEDRKDLNRRVESLSVRVESVARCPRKDCPMRQS